MSRPNGFGSSGGQQRYPMNWPTGVPSNVAGYDADGHLIYFEDSLPERPNTDTTVVYQTTSQPQRSGTTPASSGSSGHSTLLVVAGLVGLFILFGKH